MAKVTIQVSLPDAEVHAFLQHLRDFEAPRSERVHMEVLADCPDLTAAEAAMAMALDPALTHQVFINGKRLMK